MADQYVLRVTAGPDYDPSTHVEVPVNRPEPVNIASPRCDVELNVRVQNYTGLPRASPRTSPYFEREPHKSNDDQYSICFRFTPKRPSGAAAASDAGQEPDPAGDGEGQGDDEKQGIKASDLQFGNDLDYPVRGHLPPGINTALRIVKWWVDPGLDGDVYADKPFFYGPALSSMNVVHCGAGNAADGAVGLWFEEGGDDEGKAAREAMGVPSGGKERMQWALGQEAKETWVWQYGRSYGFDFFNPYLDFGGFALRLPGFQLGILRYWDGQGLR
jgi:hypothetical protein